MSSRTEAEGLRGALFVRPEQLRELDADEYWDHDLVGCSVVDTSGAEVGVVERVIPGTAQDLLAGATPRGERLVPVVRDIVHEVDVHARRVTVDPPQGLFD